MIARDYSKIIQVRLSKFLIDREKTISILEFGKDGPLQLTLSISGSETKHVLAGEQKTTTHLVH